MRIAVSAVAFALLVGGLAPAKARAISIGNPIEVEIEKQFAVGFETEYFKTEVSDETVSSNRYMAKGAWRIGPWADILMRFGAADIDVDATVAKNSLHFDSDPRFAWGGGLRVEPWRSTSLPLNPRLVVAAEALFLLSNGSVDVDLAFPSVTLKERFDANYRWREFQGSAIVLFDARPLYPYAGFSLRGVDGRVRRRQYDLTGSNQSLVADVTEDFQTDTQPYLTGGLDYRVGPTFRISGEGYYRDSDNYGFFFGMSELSH